MGSHLEQKDFLIHAGLFTETSSTLMPGELKEGVQLCTSLSFSRAHICKFITILGSFMPCASVSSFSSCSPLSLTYLI